jgi:hypothetical protein
LAADNIDYVKPAVMTTLAHFSLAVRFYSLKIAAGRYGFLIIRNEGVWAGYIFFGINRKNLVQNFWAKNFDYVGII